MNDIKITQDLVPGDGFVPGHFLPDGADEYYIRNTQAAKPLDSFRRLRADEIEALVRSENTCTNWSRFLVRDPFDPDLIRKSEFSGLVRVGRMQRSIMEHHDLIVPMGIRNSRVISCDIGDDCAIHDCHYLSHYIVGDNCILLNNDEINASNHAKFGNGVVMEGEDEEVRVWIDVMNEASGRAILPFDGMICADAWLWAKHRDNPGLMERFKAMTQALFDTRRGRYGEIGRASVLKHNQIIKDVKIGECAYIKGSNKLKNITINSSDRARTQIGEGVELVNGIVGYGCKIFYGAKAIRFVIGDNSALKYGARLIHSVLGDNSTVSCCELLNNLIFPAHEQHHNSSFLIASVVRGQSNMAAGATVGSNHNSRASDGEIDAGRGFWPGLCTSVKHFSRFASYVLLVKGDYHHELDVRLPFSLLSDDQAHDRLVIAPGWWWLHNMYALIRNESKFKSRDKRAMPVQRIEFSPFAPDTAEECMHAMELLETWTGQAFIRASGKQALDDRNALRESGRELLSGSESALDGLEVLAQGVERSSRATLVRKPREGWKAYRRIVRWYAMKTLIEYLEINADCGARELAENFGEARERSWENLGGQLVPSSRVENLIEEICSGKISSWKDVHRQYDAMAEDYHLDRARHAYCILRDLIHHDDGRMELQAHELAKEFEHFEETSHYVAEQVFESRNKDFTDHFRGITFANPEELHAVLGDAKSNSFIQGTQKEMESWRKRARTTGARMGVTG